jgi:hypothetical protein
MLNHRKFIRYSVISLSCVLLTLGACRFNNKTISENKTEDLAVLFKNPPKEARPQAWWWWLKTPTNEAAITRDLKEMKAKGLSGCMILDGGVGPFGPNKWKKKTIIGETEIKYEDTDEYNGGTLAQPNETMETWSREWRDKVRFASKEAGRIGLDLGVFIGPAGCAAPWVRPENGQQEIVWNRTSITGGKEISLNLFEPTKENAANQQINKVVEDAQLSNYTDIAILAIPSKVHVNLQEVIELSHQLDKNGNLKWNAPTGEWKIYRFGYRPTGRNLDGVFYIDHLSKEVFDKHWENTVALLLKEMSPEERIAFKYVECDSWEAGDPNWTKYFPHEFQERRGYDILKYLPILAGETIGTKENSEHFKNDYRQTISDLIAENHYARQREVANANGLHSYAEAAGPHQFQADLLKCVGHCDVAMGEFWMPSPHRPTPSGRFLVREAATAAHIYGMKHVFAEAFTSVGPNWEESPFLMKAVADQAFCDGLNWICFHTFTHRPSLIEMPGFTHSAGTHFDRTITWWNQSAPFVDYLSRCSFMLQQGLFVADVLIYKGNGIRRTSDDQNLNAMVWEDGLKNPPATLGKGYDYDKCNEEVLLSRLSVKDGKLVLPDGMSYRVLALDKNSSVSLKALRKLEELAEQGATIVGDAPIASLGINDDSVEYNKLVKRIWGKSNTGEQIMGKGRVVWNADIRDVLLQDKILPDFECFGLSDKGVIDYIHRKTDDADIYYVSSRWQPVEKVECTFRVSGKQPEIWNPVTGEIRELTDFKQENGRTIIPLEFNPCGSHFIVLRNSINISEKKPNWPSYKTVHEISGSWQVQFDENWGGPASTKFDQLIDWTLNSNKGIKYYSGKATYSKTFDLTDSVMKDKSEFYLDLGQVHELAEVRLNGVDLGVLWTKPFRVNITSAIKTKGNKLEIDVVNLWPNRLIGDEFLPENERYTKTNIRKFTKSSQLFPSGLIGPVEIKMYKKIGSQ